MVSLCLLGLFTRGRWVVKKGQNFVSKKFLFASLALGIFSFVLGVDAKRVRVRRQYSQKMSDLLKSFQKKHIPYWLYPSAYDPIDSVFFIKRSCYEEKCIYYRSFSKLFGFWCLFKLPNLGSRLGANRSWLSKHNTKKIKSSFSWWLPWECDWHDSVYNSTGLDLCYYFAFLISYILLKK